MIPASDRLIAIDLINEANRSGARLYAACAELGISIRTYQRWTREGDGTRDKRPEAIHPKASFALSEAEVQEVLDICHSAEFSSVPPGQIVPVLADRGIYIASESSFYRILSRYSENKRRGRAKAVVRRETPSHRATSPLQIWVTDISWLRGPAVGIFYYLYFVMDLFSRKIVGYEVYENESRPPYIS